MKKKKKRGPDVEASVGLDHRLCRWVNFFCKNKVNARFSGEGLHRLQRYMRCFCRCRSFDGIDPIEFLSPALIVVVEGALGTSALTGFGQVEATGGVLAGPMAKSFSQRRNLALPPTVTGSRAFAINAFRGDGHLTFPTARRIVHLIHFGTHAR